MAQLNNLKIIKGTKAQIKSQTAEENALYFADPEFVGNKYLGTDANGEIVEKDAPSFMAPPTSNELLLLGSDLEWHDMDDLLDPYVEEDDVIATLRNEIELLKAEITELKKKISFNNDGSEDENFDPSSDDSDGGLENDDEWTE